jgi:glutathione S-transferase
MLLQKIEGTMKYQLIGSKTSPFVRRLRLLMTTISYEFKELLIYETEGASYLKKINPINKIPVLIDKRGSEEKIVWDSRVIFNYLIKEENIPALTLNEENYLSAIDGALDSGVQLFLMKKNNVNIDAQNPYFKRHIERIPQVLDYLNLEVPSKWEYPAMCLYSFLDWAQFREMLDYKKHKNLVSFMEKFSSMPQVFETRPL